jgi:hypothetical protein
MADKSGVRIQSAEKAPEGLRSSARFSSQTVQPLFGFRISIQPHIRGSIHWTSSRHVIPVIMEESALQCKAKGDNSPDPVPMLLLLAAGTR